MVAQDDHLVLDAANHRLKDRIVDIGRALIPINDEASLIDAQTQVALTTAVSLPGR